MNIKVIPEVTSYPITDSPPINAFPFIPTNCSVERLVSNNEPAITTPLKLLPPKKYPLLESRFSFFVRYQDITATSAVKKINVTTANRFIFHPF